VPTDADALAMTKQVWMDTMGDLEAEVIRRAMASWTDHWPPQPLELRNAALDQQDLEHGVGLPPSPGDAWQEFRTNYRMDEDWSHPAVARAAHAIGCKAYGNSPEADVMAWRAHFFKIYEGAVKTHRRETSPLPPILARRLGVLKELDESMNQLGMGEDDE
jgi:hypothetical protein